MQSMKAMETVSAVLNVLLYKEDGRWFAHCLEYDLLGDGKTWRTAVKRLLGVIDTQIEFIKENDNLDKLYHPAPPEYWEKLSRARPLAGKKNLMFPKGDP